MRIIHQGAELQLHDCCMTHGRDWRETQGGLLPPSEHSPGCPNFRLERFARVMYPAGASCIMEWPSDAELTELAVADEDEPPTLKEIWMTRDQFDRLEEFAGP
jgi:hypothetical protein